MSKRKTSSKKSSNSTSLTFEKQFDLNKIEEIYTKVKEAVAKHEKISLVLKNMDDLDLAGLQLIESLKKSASGGKLQFEYEIKCNENTETLLNRAGFNKYLKQ